MMPLKVQFTILFFLFLSVKDVTSLPERVLVDGAHKYKRYSTIVAGAERTIASIRISSMIAS